MKKKIEEERKKEAENKIRNKQQVINRKILRTVRIVVANINLIDRRGKVELEKLVGETSKLLDMLAQTNGTLGWKVKEKSSTEDSSNKSLWKVSRFLEETSA